ncbi:hypothetical protein H072_3094 [Dactylellina haptotyla CBS 200.50]|uniref:Cytochrome P450 n=1 Tax=Dactylellina haptotyla (strain CBS 200.50) TaxID=1284197 RepID=S8BU29_DACHA|nr:hypothetical protein H072_3094 [Dactylellina haptotyla CBS 200.50]
MVSVSIITLFCASLPVYYFATSAIGLWNNTQKAKRSGLPYIIVPIFAFNPIWLLTGRKWVRWFVTAYPDAWISNYLVFLIPEWSWRYKYEPFRTHGDCFMTVTPGNCHIWVADREAISQITTRREDFPKPAWMYRTVNMFGRNVVTTEGSEWKFHRKVTSPSFGEKNNSLVFYETIRQGKQMLRKWTGDDGRGGMVIREILEDTMRLSLHVISSAGFGVSLEWPGTTKDADIIRPIGNASTHTHTLSFKDALAGLLHNLLLVLIFPRWLLRNAPFKRARNAVEAAVEYEAYMNELFTEKKMEAIAGEKAEGMDIMGVLVKNSYGPENRLNGKVEPKAPAGDVERQTLTDSEILGNAFVFLLAGHETSAGALHYNLIFLALHPDSQRQLQADIDKIFGDRPIEEWDYQKDITAMQNSMLGATMHEELRVVPPVINIPKQVSDERDQVVIVNGKKTVWPKGAMVSLGALALHRNPKYWPSTGPSKVNTNNHDLDDFVPERWLGGNKANNIPQEAAPRSVGNDASAGHLYHPLKGSYIPFADGPRSCLGKRFAQVEIMILLAMIFKQYSVELDVDKVADEVIEKMSPEDRVRIYNEQRDTARVIVRDFSLVRITVQIRNADIPLRLVPRGEERFVHLVEC